MPHSSGGGSHSGGSHSGGGGSYHSGSSGGGSYSSSISTTRLSRKPYNFCTVYCYYQDKKPVYVYSDADAKTHKLSALDIVRGIVCLLLVVPMFLMMSFWMLREGIQSKQKLTGNYDKEIIIQDNIGVIEDEDGLYDVLKDFYKKTGIVPAVMTINNEEWWNSEGRDFSSVALKKYTSTFKDECHWLIVYSEPENPDPSFNDWYWEGMQGDKTDDIVTRKVADTFTEEVHKLLLKNSVSVDDAIAGGFRKITPGIMKTDVNWIALIFSAAGAAFCVWLTIFLFDIHPIRKAILKKSFKVPVRNFKDVREETCEFCGGIYVIGCHLDCPHCGAAIKPHDYTVDAQGNVKEVLS